MSDNNYQTVKRALISVSDKSGIVEFAQALQEMGVEMLSTGGTYKLLKDNQIDAIDAVILHAGAESLGLLLHPDHKIRPHHSFGKTRIVFDFSCGR